MARLRELNDRVGRDIEANRRMISDLGEAFRERRRLAERLEEDMGSAETETRRLQQELREMATSTTYDDPVTELSVCGDLEEEEELRLPPLLIPPPEDEEDDQDLLRDVFGGVGASSSSVSKYLLSNSQLYPSPQLQQQQQQQQQHLRRLQQQLPMPHQLTTRHHPQLPPVSQADPIAARRISATGSPGSNSSSSNGSSSSSGCGTAGSSSSSNDGGATALSRASNATPDLPPLPPGDFMPPPGASASKSGGRTRQHQAMMKHLLKSADPSGDLDSNSDTGLSSLHSSSDEGTYVLDTLV